jgi:photosystem II stability/assembly factor-like uncharacterized protein
MKCFVAVALTVACCTMPLRASAAAQPSTQTLMSKLEWRSIGPFIGGRVVAVAGVPSEPNLFYMGGVEGGIWKSTNYGITWENISDGKIPGTATSIGALAVAPSNSKIIYAGTGENDPRGDFDSGDGIFKSTDAGKSWHYAGLSETHEISSIVIDPHDPNIVYATSFGHVFKPNTERGVFKTTDGGKTWKKILYVDDKTGANDIVMDPRNSRVLYAAMWQLQRQPWKLTDGGPGSGIYKTTDAGAHWTNISSHPGLPAGPLGKIGLAVAPSNPRIVYAMIQAHAGGLYRSNDGGATWKLMNNEWKLRQRGFYYMAITVDPKKPNVVYMPEVDTVWKSTNGGKTIASMNIPHGDNHIIWINPNDTKIMLEGNDGGATVSTDGGATWSSIWNQATGQFYHIAIDNQFPFHVYGAQQDEGAYEGPSASIDGSLTQWLPVALGESTFVAVDPRDPDVTYGAGYFTSLARLDDTTGEEKIVTPWPLYQTGGSSAEMKYRFGWTHPVIFSPARPDELFETAQVVFKSDDFGQTWSVLSPDLTRNDPSTEGPSGGPVDHDVTGVETFPDISSFAISPHNGDIMWAGSADGLVHVTTDGGKNWKDVTPPQLPQWAQISSIEPSHTDPASAYLTASRYQWDDFHPYIYKTSDYGAHWTAMANGIPNDQYVYAVREDPRNASVLFAGTRSTVYVSLDAGANWQSLTLNLPGVQVRDIAIDARQGDVAVATHGRSFWILDNLALIEQLANGERGPLFAPETAWLSHAYGGGGGDGTSGIPPSGENPKYGATVFFDIPSSYNGKTPVTLSFLDSSGKTVRSFSLHLHNKKAKEVSDDAYNDMTRVDQMAHDLDKETAIDPGMNAFQWDLRYPPGTEVNGLRLGTTDDYSEYTYGPTIVPGTYTVVLEYGGRASQQTFRVVLDPRLHPGPEALAARLALATQIHETLDSLNRAINAALAARQRLSPEKRAQVDDVINGLVDFRVASDEGDVMFPTYLRDQLGFLMNELDVAYQAPTAAEASTYDMLRPQAEAAIEKLQALITR